MPQALVTLPDGQKARVTFTDQAQLDATVSDLVSHHAAKPTAPTPHSSALGRGLDHVSEAIGEPALQAVTGAAGAVAGGVAGLARGVGAGAASLAQGEGFDRARQAFAEEGSDTVQRVSEAVTRQPRTAVGREATKIVTSPFTLLAKGADIAGQKVTDVTGSPAAGAAVNTAIQAAPGALGIRFTRGAAAAEGAGAGAEAAAKAEGLTATGQPRPPPSNVGEAPAPPPGATGAPQPPPGMSASGPARPPMSDVGGGPLEQKAKAYAGSIGLDWARMRVGTRKALTTIAQDATALEKLNPEAVKRQAHLEQLRVPVRATRGQLERDPVQLRREAIASNTTEGQPIRDVDIAANRDLQANLEVLRGRVGGKRGTLEEGVTEAGQPNAASVRAPTKTPTQVGESLQGIAREKAKWSKKGYQALYKLARETEPEAKVPVKPVTELLSSNPEIQHLGWVQGWLSKAAKVSESGEAPTEVKLNELHDLRSKANDIARTGGKEGYYAGQVVKAIDEAMQAAPEGAAAWKRANEAFRRHQQEFKDQGIVGKLVNDKKGGADRALALEKTWKQVATGPLEQIRQVKKTLLKGDNPALRVKGAKAWADLRAETVNRILEDARNVTAADETERAILTEAALRRSINRIPRENLEELIGKGAVKELNAILRARRITTRSPVGGRTTQSGTVPNMLALITSKLAHLVPGAKYVVGAKKALGELGERGAAAKSVEAAQVSPLEQSVRDVEAAARKRARRAAYETLERSGPTLPGPAPQPLPAGSIGAALGQGQQRP